MNEKSLTFYKIDPSSFDVSPLWNNKDRREADTK